MNPDSEVIEKSNLWRLSNVQMVLILVVTALLIWAFLGGLEKMVERWGSSEEYGYGYMLPAIAAFFIWQKKNELAEIEFSGSWPGVFAVLLGGFLLVLGELATLFIVIQYAFLVALFGLALSVTGWRGFKMILPALLLLVFMIPLPNFLYQNLSAELQLISSKLGVEVIRLFGISVFLEGNVIDLGAFKLQVVEACSGLRYLFPLAALSYMSAYLFKGSIWKKMIIFVSSVPITVFMNSFRIGVIGVLVEYWGIGMAEGFLHDFEGWFVFMACMFILLLEMWLLSKIGREKVAFADVFEITLPEPVTGQAKERSMTGSFKLVIPIIVLMSLLPIMIEDRQEIIPERKSFVDFPMELAGWNGRHRSLEREVIDVLQFDDYIMADYASDANDNINLYIAYYESQRKGASIHSPKSCIPGGGWRITSLEDHNITDTYIGNTPLVVNRLLIEKGENKQLVYYWFQQRGRIITNEYLMKWYLFWDAMTKSRTDGALVRLITTLNPGQNIEIADKRL
ncbi:MAG: VPLPA-CTERM-specific exosortase XrtD, partial [Gammaproteobacteria bacterium]|nr:VPLPA-CTERM-specific exosortase XrtD [Gammaproteobacteria bacterium]